MLGGLFKKNKNVKNIPYMIYIQTSLLFFSPQNFLNLFFSF